MPALSSSLFVATKKVCVMKHPLLENYRYYLNDSIHFFVVKRDEARERKVVYYRGNVYLAEEKLMDQDLDILRSELEDRKRAPR